MFCKSNWIAFKKPKFSIFLIQYLNFHTCHTTPSLFPNSVAIRCLGNTEMIYLIKFIVISSLSEICAHVLIKDFLRKKQSCHQQSQLHFNRFLILRLKIRSESTFLPQNAINCKSQQPQTSVIGAYYKRKAYYLNDMSYIFSTDAVSQFFLIREYEFLANPLR